MKGKLLPAALALAMSPMTLAGSTATYFPAAPEITEPTANETDVPTEATLSTSAMVPTDFNGDPAANVGHGSIALDSVRWYLADTDSGSLDSSLFVYGGLRISTAFYDNFPFGDLAAQSYDHPVPEALELSFESTSVAALRIYNQGHIEMLSDGGSVIGTVRARPTSSRWDFKPSLTEPRILVKEYSNAIAVRWGFDVDTDIEETLTLEAIIRDDERVVILADPSDMANDVYTDTGGSIGIELASASDVRSLAGWKSFISGSDDFGLFLEISDSAITPSVPDPVTLSDFAMPSFTELEAPSLNFQTTLLPGTKYQAYAQHVATSEDSPNPTIYSSFSDAVTFTTELNSEYSLDVPSTEGIQAGVPAELAFTLSNTGTDAGIPRVEVRLPFSALENLNGSLSAFFNAESDASSADCDTQIENDITTLSCSQALDAGASSTVNVTATFYETGNTDLEYRVCETKVDTCEGVEFTSLSVSVEAEGGSEPDNGSGSSSSGGGSMFWLTLLALPLLRLRRTA